MDADRTTATVAEILEQAAACHAAGAYEDCEIWCRRVLNALPEYPDALYWYALAARERGMGDVAASVLERVVQLTPEAIPAHRQLALTLRQAGRGEDAAAADGRADALEHPESAKTAPCRLCGGETRFAWFKTVLGRHIVAYAVCRGCGSLQTETPYWLDEAYGISTVGLDTGMCQRTLQLVIETYGLLDLLQVGRQDLAIDFGGGNGLFARLMQDRNYNFFSYDKYQAPFYSYHHAIDDFEAAEPKIITAFEVFEHFVNPAEEIDNLFRKNPDIIIFTTDIYANQGRDWKYLIPESGQHIFFYTPQALRQVGERYGMAFHNFGLLKLFVSPAYLARQTAQGHDMPAILALAGDRKRFLHHAMSLFMIHQYGWQERWMATLTSGQETPWGDA